MTEIWRGTDYDERRLLLLGESAYSWMEDGEIVHPSSRHAVELVEDVIEHFPSNRFITLLTRALARSEWPAKEQVRAAWSTAAFTNYIEGTVGFGPRLGPSAEMWERAGKGFQGLLDDLKPNTIIVLGKTMWSLMPDADIYLTKDVQGYKTDGGGMAMCWAVEHPSAGLSWRRLAQLIAFATNREIVELD